MKCYQFYSKIDHRTIALMAAVIYASKRRENEEFEREEQSIIEAERLFLKLEDRKILNQDFGE